MDSKPNSHPSHPSQQNSATVPAPAITNRVPLTQNQQTISKSTVDAHFASVAYELPGASTSVHALGVQTKRHAVPEFRDKFGMSEAEARAAVEMEIGRRYKSNPWDAPCKWRPRPQRKTKVEEREEGGEREQGTATRKEEGYSEEQWDLFEKEIGYRPGDSQGGSVGF